MAGLTLLTGATGYVGGRLLTLLQRNTVPVRCMARRPEVLEDRKSATTEIVAGDVLDRTSLSTALYAVETAY